MSFSCFWILISSMFFFFNISPRTDTLHDCISDSFHFMAFRTRMGTRIPTFLLFGLTAILFLLMFLYLSCSSEVLYLKRTSGDLEERVRSVRIFSQNEMRTTILTFPLQLTQIGIEHQKRLDTMFHDKHELEDQRLSLEHSLKERLTLLSQLQNQLKTQADEIQSLQAAKRTLEQSVVNRTIKLTTLFFFFTFRKITKISRTI